MNNLADIENLFKQLVSGNIAHYKDSHEVFAKL